MYVQNDTLLLLDVFENFWNMCLEIYELDTVRFLTAPGLAVMLNILKNYMAFTMVYHFYQKE